MLSDLSLDFKKINKNSVSQTITVAGFVHTVRDHGGLIFVDLRSDSDFVQVVFNPEHNKDVFEIAEKLHSEYVISVTGTVIARDEDLINSNIASGEIEIVADTIKIVSEANTLPFQIHEEGQKLAGEEVRLKYRYLDLRREKLKNMLTQKHKLFLATRNWFDTQDFVEVTTPILANPSPEGARDFIVPSRLHPGTFYALPQAPQQFKQLLMVGGFTKYFQIAPCFRDEDPRSDRHPGDFYQIDAEIAWATQEDIFRFNEKYAVEVLQPFTNLTIPQDDIDNGFIRLTYDEAMNAYGSDKPDLRYELAWKDAKEIFKDSGFEVFAKLCEETEANKHSKIQALVIKNACTSFSRSELDKIQNIGRQYGLPGIAYIQFLEEGAKSPIFKFFGDEAAQEAKKQEIINYFGIETNDLVLFIANTNKSIVYKAQNKMRAHIAQFLDNIDGTFINKEVLKFVWVYNFPFFEIEDGVIDFAHNPFGLWTSFDGKTAIETLEIAQNEGSLADIRAIQYDLTVNGYEVLSGGVRNSNRDSLIKAFTTVGYTEDEVTEKFSHMLEAYSYGAPSHAGFAWGIDRLFMVLTGEENIREIIAFPKNGQGVDAMTGSPMKVPEKNLAELYLETVDVE